MCRNIKQLHNFEPPATEEEIRAAALQFVRKLSGLNKPSAANRAAFETAIEEIARASKTLLESLTTSAPPKDRDVEQAKARIRNRRRFGEGGKINRDGQD
ncbi:MAG TPA: DUF2277 domain-containing protein [Pyrinomonadaceae bacterium]|jgi:hypothetical protein